MEERVGFFGGLAELDPVKDTGLAAVGFSSFDEFSREVRELCPKRVGKMPEVATCEIAVCLGLLDRNQAAKL